MPRQTGRFQFRRFFRGRFNAALARCAALSLYGVTEDEVDAGEVRERGAFIYPDEDFEVSPAG